ncbi:hypothetical protein BJ322DRAFT_1091332 [Thelephora terrestris]|uniref:Uncharacterized protein n=1 Tax=Thelephora terrestris TaxID=56493 RepID=A0A9P6H3B5_9AGAM|nr:hypothetical protein BJ322DRAFT_1091332 [Thelephora terrestris]
MTNGLGYVKLLIYLWVAMAGSLRMIFCIPRCDVDPWVGALCIVPRFASLHPRPPPTHHRPRGGHSERPNI